MAEERSLDMKCASCPSRQLSVFKNLNPEEVEALCINKHFKSLDRGDEIIHEGQYLKGVYCVQSGHFKLIAHSSNGRDTIVRFASPGDLIGYRSLLADEPVTVSVIALEEASACYVPREVLLNFLKENGPFSFEILQSTCHELSEANKLLASLARKKVKERLAEVLLMLRAKFGEDEEGGIAIDLKRQELADLVGTATESLIRLLSQLEKDGIIERVGKRFKVLDVQELTHLAIITD